MPIRWRWPPENSCGIAVVVLRVEPDRLHQPLHLASALALSFSRPWIANGSPMIEPIVLRGFSEEYGSWKTICISRLIAFSAAPFSRVMSRPSKHDLPGGGLEQPHDQPRRRALAAAGLADDPQRLAALDLEAHVVHRLDRADRALRR